MRALIIPNMIDPIKIKIISAVLDSGIAPAKLLQLAFARRG
jgi:hypothetical protein